MLQLMVNAHNLDATADKKDDEDEVDKLVDVKLKNETSGKQKRELTTDSITANVRTWYSHKSSKVTKPYFKF